MIDSLRFFVFLVCVCEVLVVADLQGLKNHGSRVCADSSCRAQVFG